MTRQRLAWGFSLALLAALGVATAISCGDDRRASVTRTAEPEDVVDEALLTALAQAKNLHHIADVHLSEGNTEEAIRQMQRIFSIQFPAGAPEGEDTLLDARARLAKLNLGLGRLDEAERVVTEGLAGAGRESFFVANLHMVLGEIREERAKSLEGDAKRAMNRSAIESFEKSIQINEALQKRLHQEVRP